MTFLQDSQRGEESYEKALRPELLDNFVGQTQTIGNLRIFLEAAKIRGVALDHVLLHGPPGLGKTTLARIIARELDVHFRATSGPLLSKTGDLAAILSKLETRDVLFIDEIHRLTPAVEEILYGAMEDFVLDLMIGEGAGTQSIRIDLAPFTLVGATTRSGLVSRPLRDRFGIPLALDFYTPETLVHIIRLAAHRLGLPMPEDCALLLARSSRGTPRLALRLLRRMGDFMTVEGREKPDVPFIRATLASLEIDTYGCDAVDRRYMETLAHTYGGGPVGVATLAATLSLERDVIEDVVEPYLIRQGYIKKTARGRAINHEGYEVLGLKSRQKSLLP